MFADKLKSFLSKLLNRNISFDDAFSLTSAQKARLIGWGISQGVVYTPKHLQNELSLKILTIMVNGQDSISPELEEGKNLPRIQGVTENLLGIDLQNTNELFPQGVPDDLKSDEALKSIFTLQELSYAASKGDAIETLTGIFAAKEAIIKAGSTNAALNSLEILPGPGGAPQTKNYWISISHSGGYAIALALDKRVECRKDADLSEVYEKLGAFDRKLVLQNGDLPSLKKWIKILLAANAGLTLLVVVSLSVTFLR